MWNSRFQAETGFFNQGQRPMNRQQISHQRLSRREILKYGLYGSLAAGLSPSIWLSGCGKQWRGRRPNIILIVIDTLRADHVGCYGYHRNTTPNIDRLALGGVLFKNTISSAPWTLPSIGSLLTSQYPSILGIRNRMSALDSKFPLFSELLKQYDYTTYGVVSHTQVSACLGFGRGYDHYDEESVFASPQDVKKRFRTISSPLVTRKAVSFLQKSRRKPFFLFTHYFDPHFNYVLHEKYNYYPLYKGSLYSGQAMYSLRQKRQSLSADDIKYLLALYDSEIAFTDEYVGRLLDELKRQGLYDDCIIIVTADHGEEFMERGWLGHTITLYQELIRVPLIMKFPGGKAQIIDSPVGLIDVMPTVLDYLGIDLPGGLQGKTLSLVNPVSIPKKPIFSETFKTQPTSAIGPIAFTSVLLGNRKLIHDGVRDSEKIFNLSEDPHEQSNLSDQQSEENRMLRALLSKWLSYIEMKRSKEPVQDETELFTPEQIEHLYC